MGVVIGARLLSYAEREADTHHLGSGGGQKLQSAHLEEAL